jgi:hypothetical protein
VEAGVGRGDFSAFILKTVQPQKLYLIDQNFEKHSVDRRFANSPEVTCLAGHSADMLRSLPDGHCDWTYIDAGHDYANVRADATVAATKIKPGGILIFNDYIVWSHHEGIPYGVVQTVNEMCVNEGWKVVAFCLHDNMYCDVALKRR